MKTIELQDFTNDFMQISNNLTLSEIKMLYLLITDEDTRYYTQQEFAEIIGTNRRTINLGFKKLLKYKYIYDIYKADSYTWVYNILNNNFLKEDHLTDFNNNRRLPSYVRYSREFVIETMEKNISNMVMYYVIDRKIIKDKVGWLNSIKIRNREVSNIECIVNIEQILRIKGRRSILTKEDIRRHLSKDDPCHYIMIEIAR